MQLHLFKTLWGASGSIEHSIEQAVDAGFQGIEGPAPNTVESQFAMSELLEKNNLNYIAEITTAGSYVPDRHATLQKHLDSLDKKLDHSAALNP